jgi:hypothetical protein
MSPVRAAEWGGRASVRSPFQYYRRLANPPALRLNGSMTTRAMTIFRVVGFVVLILVCALVALASICIALAVAGIETPGFSDRAPAWLQATLLIGAVVFFVFWIVSDFSAVRGWFRRGGSPR